ncbi:MAG TPA: SsrA-binding protein SmpB [Candidatus Paceibacterota bacterium]|nr:SsrA-binding protein SmpB [Candidatus Paceibacterota bacterium]HPT18259.1 SsrA-binding protein SmpB [Candidatus Paceibacterota bacterium]
MAFYSENRKARFNYEFLDKYEAGIELLGIEVKSIRAGQISLEGSFVIVRGGEVFLINANIPPYQPNNTPKEYDPLRNRKLLLTKDEIKKLSESDKNKNLTIIPISVYNKDRKIKVEIVLAKGKKKFDKRENIKKRDIDRELRREYKDR